MMTCTNPERWVSVPGADAPEEEVARYLAHVGECPFHAALEEREVARVRGVAALASGTSAAPNLRDHGVARGAGQDRRKSHGELIINTLSIRVDGKELARIDLAAQRWVTLEVEAAALIAVWQSSEADGGDDMYLTSYVLPADGKEVSTTVLDGGQRISFMTEASADTRMLITVTYAAANWWSSLGTFMEQRKHTAAERARALRWSPARLAVTLCSLLVALLFVFVFILRTEEPLPVANQDHPRQPGVEHAPPFENPAPSPPTASEEKHDVSTAPFPTPAPQAMPGRRGETQAASNSTPPSRTGKTLTVADVRRIYVSPGDNAYDQQLRAALIEQLRASATFTVVMSERQADAVLRREQSRGTDVSVQLLSRTGKSIWFTTQPTDAAGVPDVSKVAARIVTALTAAADKRRSSVNSPQP